MDRKIQSIFVLLLLISSTSFPLVNALNSTTTNCSVSKNGTTRVVQSSRNVCVGSTLKDNQLQVIVRNPTKEYMQKAGFVVYVDNTRFQQTYFNMSPGQTVEKYVDITRGLSVVKNNHTVTISATGNATSYNFTEEINTSTTKIPTPYIANVTVADGTIDGKPSSVAYVTIVNPSMRRYSTKLFVHTLGTDGSFYVPSPQPHNSTRIKVELLDKEDTKIAGEARLYTGNLTKKSGGIDQVGFAGKAGEETEQWNESFQPVRPTWMSNHYHYTNDTYSQGPAEKLSGNQEVGGIPIIYFTPALFIGLLFVWRWR